MSEEIPVYIPYEGSDEFRINTVERLEWYGRKRSTILSEMDAIKARYESIAEDLKRDLEQLDAHFETQAREFVARELAGKKTKAFKTLGGTWSFRFVAGGIRKKNMDELAQWASMNAPWIVQQEVVYKVSSDALKEYFSETGEIPPGAELVPDRESFTFKA